MHSNAVHLPKNELRKLLAVAEGEWEGLVLGGLYTGQRLGDLTSLTGRQVDLTDELIKFRSHKTGRDMVIPIAAPILEYFKRHFPKNLDAPIFPNANAVRRKIGPGESAPPVGAVSRVACAGEAGQIASQGQKQRERSFGQTHRQRVVVSQPAP